MGSWTDPASLALISVGGTIVVAGIAAWATLRSTDKKNEFAEQAARDDREEAARVAEIEARAGFVGQLQRRCEYLEGQLDTVLRRLSEALANLEAMERRWRHFANSLITYASIVTTKAEAVGVAVPTFTGYDRFVEEGGVLEDHWQGHLGLGEDRSFPRPEHGTVILVVDDDKEYTRVLARTVRAIIKRPVHVVSRVQEVMPCLRLGQFQVAVFDLRLPDGYDGLDIILQARSEDIDIPMIILSGEDKQAEELDPEKLKRARVAAVMSKSHDRMSDIVKQIERCLSGDVA
jgi:CheY-like chemotaxis protein